MTSFVWRLPELMWQRGMRETSALRPLLSKHGVNLSREQVFRMVRYPPERLSIKTLIALCAIFECTPNELLCSEAGTALMPSKARARRKPASRKPPSRKRPDLSVLEVQLS